MSRVPAALTGDVLVATRFLLGLPGFLRQPLDGATALMKASLWCHLPVVQLLLLHGADVGACDTDGWTAFKLAAEKGHLEVCRLLRAAMPGS